MLMTDWKLQKIVQNDLKFDFITREPSSPTFQYK